MTQQYLDLLQNIKDNGNIRGDRTGTGTKSLFGLNMSFDLNEGFPLLTTKKVHFKGIALELLWFIAGDTNNTTLKNQGVNIWNEWALPKDAYKSVKREVSDMIDEYAEREEIPRRDVVYQMAEFVSRRTSKPITGDDLVQPSNHEKLEASLEFLIQCGVEDTTSFKTHNEGALGPVYGEQWRAWKTPDGRIIDQLAEQISNLKTRPFSRRHVISAWNVADLPDETISPQENVKEGKMALAPCHCFFQFYVEDFTVNKYIEMLGKLGHQSQAVRLASAQSHQSDEDVEALMHSIAKEINQPVRRLSCRLDQRKLH